MELGKDNYIVKVFRSYTLHYPQCIYGMKITHFRKENIERIIPLLDMCWPDCYRITMIRNPIDIVKRNIRVSKDGLSRISMNERDPQKIMDLQLDLCKNHGFKTLCYPTAWDTGVIAIIVERLGLKWNPEILRRDDNEIFTYDVYEHRYIHTKPSRSTYEEIQEFNGNNAKLTDSFVELLLEYAL